MTSPKKDRLRSVSLESYDVVNRGNGYASNGGDANNQNTHQPLNHSQSASYAHDAVSPKSSRRSLYSSQASLDLAPRIDQVSYHKNISKHYIFPTLTEILFFPLNFNVKLFGLFFQMVESLVRTHINTPVAPIVTQGPLHLLWPQPQQIVELGGDSLDVSLRNHFYLKRSCIFLLCKGSFLFIGK